MCGKLASKLTSYANPSNDKLRDSTAATASIFLIPQTV